MAARSWCGFLVTASIVPAAGCTPEAPLPDPVAAPVFSPAGGAYDDVLDVTIATDTEGAGIRYTFDGSTPSSIYGRAYDGFPLTVSSSVTIRAVAWQDGRPDSEVAAGTTGLYAATAVTDTTICIAYYEAGAADLKLAYSLDDGAGWTLRPLDTSASDVGKYASIAMNGTKVYVAYYDATAGDLRFGWAPTPGGAWVSSALDASGNVGPYASLRYDAASATIWLAYYDVTWSRLKVVKSVPNESSWTLVGVIDDSGATGQYASLSVSGASGQDLAIAYYEDWECRLKVARSGDTGASWTTEVVAEGGEGQWASIACTGSDGNGKPTYAVGCYDSLAGDLRLARYDGTGWTFR